MLGVAKPACRPRTASGQLVSARGPLTATGNECGNQTWATTRNMLNAAKNGCVAKVFSHSRAAAASM